MRKGSETKCFSQTLATNVTVTNGWAWYSALAGLTQGTGTTARVGSKITLVAVEFFIQIVPSTANVPDNGSACRFVVYHNKACGAALPATAEVWDNNALITGRFVNYAKKYSILEDITHQMVVYSRDSTGKYSSGPQLAKMLRVSPRTTVEYGGNGGTISDLPIDDIGFGVCADDVNCCTISVYSKVWYKDV